MMRARRFAAGLTLIELMVSLAIGLLVMLAATALLLSGKQAYVTQDEQSRMDENARYAIEVIARAVRQAGFPGPDAATAVATPAVGLDASSVDRNSPGIGGGAGAPVNHSDVLALRYLGSGLGDGDGTMLNCAGFPVPGHADNAGGGIGWSIFHVAADSGGEPQLYCKYPGEHGWASDAVVRGVESLQVLYMLDANDDGLAEQLVPAQALGPVADGRHSGSSAWSRVAGVRIALLMRSEVDRHEGSAPPHYDLFGQAYGEHQSASDPGTRIVQQDFAPVVQKRMRRIYTATVLLRNRSAFTSTASAQPGMDHP